MKSVISSLNTKKTNNIIFHSSSVPSDFYIKIEKKHIKRVKFVKLLGLLHDEHFIWRYHLCDLSKKLARTCGMFLKIRNLHPLDVLICLYNAWFLSFLQYSLVVLGQTYASYTDTIFNLQKEHSERSHFNLPCFSLYQSWMVFNFWYFLRSLNSDFQPLFTILLKTSPISFHGFFLFSSYVHQYATRPVKVISICP